MEKGGKIVLVFDLPFFTLRNVRVLSDSELKIKKDENGLGRGLCDVIGKFLWVVFVQR